MNGLCLIALAYTTNFWVSLVVRFLHGLLDGSIPLSKAMITEISNSRNISLGTTLFFAGMSIGGFTCLLKFISRLVGPFLFSWCAKPENISGLITRFPIFGEVIQFCKFRFMNSVPSYFPC